MRGKRPLQFEKFYPQNLADGQNEILRPKAMFLLMLKPIYFNKTCSLLYALLKFLRFKNTKFILK